MSSEKINYMIIDDEPIAHRIIEDYCEALPNLNLVNHSYNALEAIQFLVSNSTSNNVDIMFLDLNMPKLKGFDFLKTLTNKPQVIVTTAYAEFAIEGFELDVCDYLLKPFSFERFLKAINKASQSFKPLTLPQNNMQIEQSDNTKSKQIFIKGDKKHHQIALDDIAYIQACGNYCLVYLSDNSKIITHQKISEIEQSLPQTQFMRVHKSYLIAVDKIDTLAKNQISINQSIIPIGQTYKLAVNGLLEK